MRFENWKYHLNQLKEFHSSDYFNFCFCETDDRIFNLFYGYISAIGEELVCDVVAEIYYGENSTFWVDCLIEDFLEFGYAIVPNLADTAYPHPVIGTELEAELDYQHGIPLNTEEELYNFITTGKLPIRNSIYIAPEFNIRINANK